MCPRADGHQLDVATLSEALSCAPLAPFLRQEALEAAAQRLHQLNGSLPDVISTLSTTLHIPFDVMNAAATECGFRALPGERFAHGR